MSVLVRTEAGPRRLLYAALAVSIVLPLVVALVVLRQPRWIPELDLAMTEMRVRDVATVEPPRVGLVGRMHDGTAQGSHPGPLSFFVLWPVHRLLGGSAWAFLVASVVVHALAVATTIWIAARRGGLRLVVLVAVALAVLVAAYGAELLTMAWNPYLPLLWWFAFLLAVWAVLDDDLVLLPIVVLAGSFAAQTHIGYVGTAAALAALALGWSLVRAWRGGTLGAWSRWALPAMALGALVWLPPAVEQVVDDPGNATIIWNYLRQPDEPTVGPVRAVRVVAVHANPWRLVTSDVRHDLGAPGEAEGATVDASPWPGALLLAAWAAAVVMAWRLRARRLLLLHLVVGTTLLVEVVTVSRVFGVVWYYLVLWAWGTTALLLVAVVATAATALRTRPAAQRAGTVALVAALAVVTSVAAVDAATTEVNEPWEPAAVEPLLRPTETALAARGDDGSYLVTWSDQLYLGSPGWALANELHRAGFDVGTNGRYHVGLQAYRRVLPEEATAEVHLAIGPGAVDEWRSDPKAEEIASSDPRDDEEDAEYARLRRDVIDGLDASGHEGLVAAVDDSLTVVELVASVPKAIRQKVQRMLVLGDVAAVFVSHPIGGR